MRERGRPLMRRVRNRMLSCFSCTRRNNNNERPYYYDPQPPHAGFSIYGETFERDTESLDDIIQAPFQIQRGNPLQSSKPRQNQGLSVNIYGETSEEDLKGYKFEDTSKSVKPFVFGVFQYLDFEGESSNANRKIDDTNALPKTRIFAPKKPPSSTEPKQNGKAPTKPPRTTAQKSKSQEPPKKPLRTNPPKQKSKAPPKPPRTMAPKSKGSPPLVRKLSKWEMDMKRDLEKIACKVMDSESPTKKRTIIEKFDKETVVKVETFEHTTEETVAEASEAEVDKLAESLAIDAINHAVTFIEEKDEHIDMLATELSIMALQKAMDDVSREEECKRLQHEQDEAIVKELVNMAMQNAVAAVETEEKLIAEEVNGLLISVLTNVTNEDEFVSCENEGTRKAFETKPQDATENEITDLASKMVSDAIQVAEDENLDNEKEEVIQIHHVESHQNNQFDCVVTTEDTTCIETNISVLRGASQAKVNTDEGKVIQTNKAKVPTLVNSTEDVSASFSQMIDSVNSEATETSQHNHLLVNRDSIYKDLNNNMLCSSIHCNKQHLFCTSVKTSEKRLPPKSEIDVIDDVIEDRGLGKIPSDRLVRKFSMQQGN